jgi:hypothetical protein
MFLFGTVTALVFSCGGSVSNSEVCGAGTHDDGGTCLPNPGKADDAGSSCGPGTVVANNGQCVPAPPQSVLDSGMPIDNSNPAKACLVADNKFVLGGTDFIHMGPPVVIEGGAGWQVTTQAEVDGKPAFVTIEIGSNWTIILSTKSLGKPLATGMYTNAETAAVTDPSRPGLDVYGDGKSCNGVTGSFTIVDIQSSPGPDGGYSTVTSLTASFEQHCEGGSNSNTGCIHFTQ